MTQNGKGDKQRVRWSKDFERKFKTIFKKSNNKSTKKTSDN